MGRMIFVLLAHIGLLKTTAINVRLNGLGQCEQVLRLIMAHQRRADGLHRRSTSTVTVLCEFIGIPLTFYDVPNDPQGCLAGDVIDDMMALNIHLRQRFLPVLSMSRRIVKQPAMRAFSRYGFDSVLLSFSCPPC